MKLTKEAIINKEKLLSYLLEPKRKNDKSRFLSYAGYTKLNYHLLEKDIRKNLDQDAIYIKTTEYGDLYRITGELIGPNKNKLEIVTIWMIETFSNSTKFITLYPVKKVEK